MAAPLNLQRPSLKQTQVCDLRMPRTNCFTTTCKIFNNEQIVKILNACIKCSFLFFCFCGNRYAPHIHIQPGEPKPRPSIKPTQQVSDALRILWKHVESQMWDFHFTPLFSSKDCFRSRRRHIASYFGHFWSQACFSKYI